MRRRDSWKRLFGAAFLAGSLAIVPFAGGQKADKVDRILAEMSPDARVALEQTLKEQGMSLDNVRNNPALLTELLSGETRRNLEKAVQKKLKASEAQTQNVSKVAAPTMTLPNGKALPPMPSSQPSKGGANYGNLPERYRVIAERNLFRPLGWSGVQWNNPFSLIGIAASGGKKRAIMSMNGMGLYVGVGENVGEGYRVASISGNIVRLTGGSHGELTLQLDTGMVGLAGAPAPIIQPMGKQPVPAQKVGDGRWRPMKGTSQEAIIKEILAREQLREGDLGNPKIEAKLKDKYGYLIEEGYVKK